MGRRKGKKKRTAGRNRDEFLVVGTPHARLGAAAALSSNAFKELLVQSAIPSSWDERALRAVEYYQEEPLVANAINAWRTFALGDEIQVNCDNEEGNRSPPSISSMIARCLAGCKDFFGRSSISS